MKVLAVIVIAPHMSASGAVNAAKALSQKLSFLCDVEIAIMSDTSKESKLGNASLREFECSNLLSFTKGFLPNKFRTLLYRSGIPEHIDKSSYDLVHIHNPIPTLEMQRIASACNARGIPYVISTHGFVELASGGKSYGLSKWYEKLAWKYLIEKPLLDTVRGATRIFALSELERPILEGFYSIAHDKIDVVSNGVNEYFLEEPVVEELNSTALKFGLPYPEEQQVVTALFLGNHTANKGLDVLMSAFKQLKTPFRLIVCGKKKEGVPYDEYEQSCSKDQSIIFTDFASDSEVRSLMAYSNIFVYPTLADTLPLVIFEAMASGLPVLSTRVGGIPHQVPDTIGTLVEPGNVQEFVDAYLEMTVDAESLAKKGKLSKSIVQSSFSWEKAAQSALEYYEDIA